MEHEMRLAVLPRASGPTVVPYCVGCGWVGRREAPDSLQSVPAEWRTHLQAPPNYPVSSDSLNSLTSSSQAAIRL